MLSDTVAMNGVLIVDSFKTNFYMRSDVLHTGYYSLYYVFLILFYISCSHQEGAPKMYRSRAAGHAVTLDHISTIASGMAIIQYY